LSYSEEEIRRGEETAELDCVGLPLYSL
jgi:hypothetical protein